MMNFQELQRELKDVIQDSSATIVASIPDYINEAVQQIAEDVNLPTLKKVFSLTTSTSLYYVNTASTFSGRLKYVGDSTQEYSVIDGGLEALLGLHPDVTESGDIDFIALEGNVLYYLPIPATAVALTCIGYNFPATLVNDTDTPSDIPSFYHREIIVNKAAAIAYSVIESGASEKDKTNYMLFNSMYEAGLNRLRGWASRRRSNIVTSYWSD
jgi:hypothetical protein